MVWIAEDISTLALIFVGTCVATLLFAMALSPKDNWRALLGLISGLAMLGCISGYMGGLSRTSAVGDIIPAALAIAGGAAAYLFGADRSKGLIASICALALGLSLFLGFSTSAVKRGKVEAFQAHLTFCRQILSDADIMSDTDAFVRVISLHGESCAGVISAELAIARNLPSDAQGPDDFGYLVNAMNGLLARAGVESGQ